MKNNKKFKFFPKTADAKFQAYGATLEEAFANAALAMFSIMTDTKKIAPAIEEKIAAEAEGIEPLLYDFLVKLLVLMDSKGFLLHDIEVERIDNTDGKYSIRAIARGDIISAKYEAHDIVKAVTYNEMKIGCKEKKWLVQVVCDI
jgi:SHS2 domain-containing protein